MNNVSSEKQLHILYYNARSVLSKMDELRATMSTQHPHIVCVVETWLSPDISDNELQISDYQLVRLDRDRHGGGILMYVHFSVYFKVLIFSGPYNLEFLALSLFFQNLCHFLCVYLSFIDHHPHQSRF